MNQRPITRPTQFLFLILALAFSSCKTFTSLPNSYLVRGDNNAVSIPGKTQVYVGDLLNQESWAHTSQLLNDKAATPKNSKLLKKLGYNKKEFSVLFSSAPHLPISWMAVLPNTPDSATKKPAPKMDLLNYKHKATKNAYWYYESTKTGNSFVYHALIPMTSKIPAKRVLTLVLTTESEADLPLIEEVVRKNAESFQNPGIYLTNMPAPGCPKGEEDLFYNYRTPQNIIKLNDYYLVKAYVKGSNEDLVFLGAMGKPLAYSGSFKLCKGEYHIEFSKLSGEILWEEDTVIR